MIGSITSQMTDKTPVDKKNVSQNKEKISEELLKLLEDELLNWPKVTSRLMFGYPSYQVEGRLFAFLADRGIVLTQLLKSDREKLGEQQAVSEFQAGERTIEHWVQVSLDNKRELNLVMPFLRKSYDIALTRALDK